MKKLRFLLPTLAIGLFAISCSTPCPPAEEPETIDMDAVKAEIMALEEAYQNAENARGYQKC